MGLNYISPDASTIVKVYIIKLINLDFSVIMDVLSYVSKIVFSLFSFMKTIPYDTKVKEEQVKNDKLKVITVADTILEKDNIEYRKLN